LIISRVIISNISVNCPFFDSIVLSAIPSKSNIVSSPPTLIYSVPLNGSPLPP
jgi:hypothetical protein